MDLTVTETANRHRCGNEVLIDGLKVQCPFSTAKVVTIPAGLIYLDGKFEYRENAPQSRMPICKNHENRLNAAFRELSQSNAR